MVIHRFASELDKNNISYVLEKNLITGLNQAGYRKSRADCAIFNKNNKLAAIVEFKGYATSFSNSKERISCWNKTRQSKKYDLFGVPVFFVCDIYTYVKALEDVIKLPL